jgi:hypothetical protein
MSITTIITKDNAAHPCQFRDENLVALQLSFLPSRDILVASRVNRTFCRAAPRVFEQSAATAANLVNEAVSAIDKASEYALSPREAVSRQPLKIIVSYLGNEIYRLAEERLNQYYGPGLFQYFGGMRGYTILPQLELPQGYDNDYIDGVKPDTMKDSSGALCPLMKLADERGRLGLAIVFRDGFSRGVKVIHQREANRDQGSLCVAGQYGRVDGLDNNRPDRGTLTATMQQVAAGTHLRIVIDIPRLLRTHQELLTQRIMNEFATFLQFTKMPLFSTPLIRTLIAEYITHSKEEAISEILAISESRKNPSPVTTIVSSSSAEPTPIMKTNKEYQNLVTTWTKFFPSDFISSIGGVYSASRFKRIESKKDLEVSYIGYDSEKLLELARERLTDAMQNRDILVIKQHYPQWIAIKFQDKESQHPCIYLVYQQEIEGQEPSLVFAPLPGQLHPIAAVAQLAGPPSADKYSQLKLMMLGMHPTVCVADSTVDN